MKEKEKRVLGIKKETLLKATGWSLVAVALLGLLNIIVPFAAPTPRIT